MYERDFNPISETDAEEALYYWDMRVQSYESKLRQLAPDTPEFEAVMTCALSARRRRADMEHLRDQLHNTSAFGR